MRMKQFIERHSEQILKTMFMAIFCTAIAPIVAYWLTH